MLTLLSLQGLSLQYMMRVWSHLAKAYFEHMMFSHIFRISFFPLRLFQVQNNIFLPMACFWKMGYHFLSKTRHLLRSYFWFGTNCLTDYQRLSIIFRLSLLWYTQEIFPQTLTSKTILQALMSETFQFHFKVKTHTFRNKEYQAKDLENTTFICNFPWALLHHISNGSLNPQLVTHPKRETNHLKFALWLTLFQPFSILLFHSSTLL